MIATKRAYEPAEPGDGYRVLIDRLWPRGMSKAKARLDAWEKDVAPSRELREWYGHDPAKWPKFRTRYTRERVTLVYGSRAAEISNVAVLERVLRRRLRVAPRGSRSRQRC